MKCLICERTEDEVMLLRAPVEAIYLNVLFEVVGNLEEGEYICLPCVGYQWDEINENAL